VQDSTRQPVDRNQGSIQELQESEEEEERARVQRRGGARAGMDQVRGSSFLLGVLLAGTYHAIPSSPAIRFF
jgi:hypothetical protein